MEYAKFYFKGGLIITGRIEDVVVDYNPYMKNHPIGISIIPLESVWSGGLHFITHTKIRFALWDLKAVVLLEEYLNSECRTKKFLTVVESPRYFYYYWKRIAEKLEKLIKENKE